MKTLKKSLLLISACLLFSVAQSQSIFNEKDMSAGIGLGLTVPYGISPGFGLKINGEYGIKKIGPGVISGGITVGVGSYKYTSSGYWGSSSTARTVGVFVGGKGVYHWSPDEDKMDLYGGVMIGGILGSYITRFDPGAFVGINYFFSDKIAVNGEVGYAFTLISGGLTFAF